MSEETITEALGRAFPAWTITVRATGAVMAATIDNGLERMAVIAPGRPDPDAVVRVFRDWTHDRGLAA